MHKIPLSLCNFERLFLNN